MTTRHQRLRRIAKWVGAAFSVIVTAAWLLTVPLANNKRLWAGYTHRGRFQCALDFGTIRCTWYTGPPRHDTSSKWETEWRVEGLPEKTLRDY